MALLILNLFPDTSFIFIIFIRNMFFIREIIWILCFTFNIVSKRNNMWCYSAWCCAHVNLWCYSAWCCTHVNLWCYSAWCCTHVNLWCFSAWCCTLGSA